MTRCWQLLWTLAGGLACSGSLLAEPVEVRIGTGEWSPYVEQQRADAGAFGRLASVIFQRAGYRVRFFFYPWARDEFLLKRGELDAIMPYICTPAREQFSLCSQPVAYSRMVLFHRRDQSLDWQRISDLKGLRMAVTQGYSYGAELDAAISNQWFTVVQNSDEERGFRLLLSRRADAFPQDLAVGYHMLGRQFTSSEQSQLIHSERRVAQNYLTLLWRKDEQGGQLRQVFDAGLAELARKGDLERLQEALNSGHPGDWTPSP